MFKIIDLSGYIQDCYGAFLDEDGDVQFIICDEDGEFYVTHSSGFYKLYKENKN